MIGLVIPFHLKGNKKNDAYKMSFKHYSHLDIPVHLCGSEGAISRDFASEFLSSNVKYFEIPQVSVCTSSKGDDTIRKKFNDSLNTLPKELEWFCLAGADDLVGLDFFDRLKEISHARAVMAGVGMDYPLYLVKGDYRKRVELRYRNVLKLNAGVNAFNSKAFKGSNFTPYILAGCETGAEKYFSKKGVVMPLEGVVVSIKGEDVLNSYEKIVSRHISYDLTSFENELVDSFLGL